MCWKCGNDIAGTQAVARNAECPVCHADLHACRNCQFYEPGRRYDCHETVDELVRDKERSNFCDSFKVRRHFEASGGNSKSAEARKKLDALFSI